MLDLLLLLCSDGVARCVGCVGSSEQTEPFTHNLRYGRHGMVVVVVVVVLSLHLWLYNFMAEYARGASA